MCVFDAEEKLLKLAVRIPLMSVLIVMLGLCLTGCFRGQQGIPPITLEHARQMAADPNVDPEKAIEEYTAVQSEFDGKDNETAALALVESAKFASDPARYVTPKQRAEAEAAGGATKREELEVKGLTSARASLKQLEQRYSSTKTYRAALNDGLLASVESKIDERNSHTWQFKIVDALVKLTGSRPGFSYWFALVLIAFFIKAVTFPLLLKTYASQREMQKIQPIIKEIQAKYKDDQTEMNTRIMAAYKEHGVNPLASCLPALVQIPIFWGMFSLVHAYEIHFAHGQFLWISPYIANSSIGKMLGMAPNLAHLDIPILILYALSMWLSMQLTPSPDPQMAAQQRQMSIMMIGMMIYWFLNTRWSSAFLLYYLVQNILSSLQQYYFIYKPNKENAAKNLPGPVATDTSSEVPEKPSRKYAPGAPSVTRTETEEDTPVKENMVAGATSNRPRPKRKPRR